MCLRLVCLASYIARATRAVLKWQQKAAQVAGADVSRRRLSQFCRLVAGVLAKEASVAVIAASQLVVAIVSVDCRAAEQATAEQASAVSGFAAVPPPELW